VQVADALKLPEESVEKLTVPVGPVGLDEASVTVPVQVVAVPVATEPGEQATLVVVVRSVTVRVSLVEPHELDTTLLLASPL
jgi:hypothetical protein